MQNRDIEQQVRETDTSAAKYTHDARSGARDLLERGRRRIRERLDGAKPYRQRLSHAAEDLSDEANYQYRRLRRQVNRHPAATIALAAGTIGALLLLRRAFRRDTEH